MGAAEVIQLTLIPIPRPVGPRPQGVSTPGAPAQQAPPTKRAQLKAMREELRFAQMQVRLDLYGLTNSKAKVKRIAAAMRKLQGSPND